MEGSQPTVRTGRTAQRASRPVPTLRGAVGATAATLIAAASHALAGGDITWLAIVATAALSLPLCVLLAGRIASLWRLALSVGAAQFLYHWTFAGLGAAGGSGAAGTAGPVHAGHLATAARFAPDVAAVPGTFSPADAVMWLGHAAAAALTIALLHRGERAALALLRLIRRAIPCAAPRFAGLFRRPEAARCETRGAVALRDRLLTAAAITHRGPPLAI